MLCIVNGLYDNNLGSNTAGVKQIPLKEIRASVLSVLIHIHVPYMHVGRLAFINIKISLNQTIPSSQHYFPMYVQLDLKIIKIL